MATGIYSVWANLHLSCDRISGNTYRERALPPGGSHTPHLPSAAARAEAELKRMGEHARPYLVAVGRWRDARNTLKSPFETSAAREHHCPGDSFHTDVLQQQPTGILHAKLRQ